jgi:hypothetical protein
MRYIIKENFHEDYIWLKDHLPENGCKGTRSHEDITESDSELTRLFFRCGGWQKFWEELHTFDFWQPYLSEFGISDITKGMFNEGYIEERGGQHWKHDFRFFYSRMDIGYAYKGYGIDNGGKGNHIDNRNRVLSGLWYFTDQSKLNGGEFQITNKEGDVLKTIEIEENMAIISVQDKDGWHKVNPLRDGKRIAVYFALCCSEDYWIR